MFRACLLGLLLQDAEADEAVRRSPSPTETVVESLTELPLHLEGLQPAIDVTIGGEVAMRLLVDTGTGYSLVLSKARAQAVEEHLTDERLDEVMIGDALFYGVPLRAPADGAVWEKEGIDGILGLPFFAGCTLELDFARKQLRIHGRALEEGEGDVMPFSNDPTMPDILTVRLDVAGEAVDAHLDTGSPELLMLSELFEKELPLGAEPRTIGRANTPMGSAEIRSAPLKGDLVFGALRFSSPDVHFSSLPQIRGKRIGNLGCRALTNTCLVIDVPHRRLAVRVVKEKSSGA